MATYQARVDKGGRRPEIMRVHVTIEAKSIINYE